MQTSRVASKIERWEQISKKASTTTDHRAFIERVPEARKKRIKKREKLSEIDQLSIVHSVLVEMEYQTDVAKGYRVSTSRVNQIIKKASQNNNLFNAMRLR